MHNNFNLEKPRIEKISESFQFLHSKIKNGEIGIDRISLFRIIENYLRLLLKTHFDYIDLEIVANFLIAVSEILLWKSDLLLPSTQIQVDVDTDIDDDLDVPREYFWKEQKRYQMLVKLLVEREFEQNDIYSPYLNSFENFDDFEMIPQKHDYSELLLALELVLSKNTNQDLLDIENSEINIEKKIEELENIFFKTGKILTFSQIIPENCLKIDIIITFLALLQLICLGKVDYQQTKNFGEIIFYKKSRNIKENRF